MGEQNSNFLSGIIPIGPLIDANKGTVVIDQGDTKVAISGSTTFVSSMLDKYFLREDGKS